MRSTAHFSQLLTPLTNLVEMYKANYAKDGTTLEAYIDTLCEFLQAHKSPVAPVEPVVPAAQAPVPPAPTAAQ